MTGQHLSSSITGIVLAGGNSSRMGMDKARMVYNGLPQADRMRQLLSPFCESVYLAVREFKSGLPLPQLRDHVQWGHIGPMNPVLTAFMQFPEHALMVTGCDYPYCEKETIRVLVKHRNPGKDAVAFLNPVTNRPEPLLAIYEPQVFPKIKAEFEKGNHSLQRVLEQLDIERIEAGDERWIRSVDTPEDVAHFQQNLVI